jgi:glucose/arabinose dehydrogenase
LCSDDCERIKTKLNDGSKNEHTKEKNYCISEHLSPAKWQAILHKNILSVSLISLLILSSTVFLYIPGNFGSGYPPSVHAQGHAAPPEPLIPQGIINSGKPPSTSIFNIIPGYKIQPILWNLTLPSSVTFDDNGTMYIAESGYTYGDFMPAPRILQVSSNGQISVLVDRGLNGPITDLEFNNKNGLLYVSHKGLISAVDHRGAIKDLVAGLPSGGDHFNNQIAFGSDGRFYFGQGTATNSGVVGDDNYQYGWLKISPQFHDIPGKNITLSGQNFKSFNPLTPQDLNDYSTTGAFSAFGSPSHPGQVIKGDVKCGGCIISAKSNGTDLKTVAWGLRNPYGVALSGDGKKLIISSDGADDRGSRRIGNDEDKIYAINIANQSNLGKFYGWPDFFGNGEPVTDPKFKSESSQDNKPLQFLMKNHPLVEKPLTLLSPLGVAATQVAVSTNSSFGLKNMAFIGEYGTMGSLIHPYDIITGPSPQFSQSKNGPKVIMVNTDTGNYTNFISPKTLSFDFRPVGIKFNLNGDALYVVSIGKTEIRTSIPPTGHDGPFSTTPAVPWTYANSGVIWKVTKINNNNSNSGTSPTKDFILKQVPSSTSPPGSVVIKQPNTVNQVTISAFNYINTAMSNGTNISKSNATKALDASNLTKINTSQIK